MSQKRKKQFILAIVSEKGGGKGTASAHLEEKYRAKNLRFSFFIEELLRSMGAPEKDRDIMIQFIEKLRELFGKDVLAKILVKKIERMKNRLIVLDGMRFLEEQKYLKKHFHNFQSIGISTDAKNRYIRTKERGEKVNESRFTYSQFIEEQSRSTEKNIPRLMKQVDHKIKNDGTLKEFYEALDTIMKKIYK